MTEPDVETEYERCPDCRGTGRDEIELDGRCVRCAGTGEITVEYCGECGRHLIECEC